MTQSYRCVICLAKSGSSQIAKNFRYQGAVHEYAFKTIAELSLKETKREKRYEYLKNRKKSIGDNIDVSTTLIHLCDEEMIKELNMRPVFIVRNPLDWIASVIKYGYHTREIGELELDGGWRKAYGEIFVPDEEIPFEQLEDFEPKVVKILINPLMKTWLKYTTKIYNMAIKLDNNLNNVYTTESLSEIETHKKIAGLYCLPDTPPIDFFMISNETTDKYAIKCKLMKEEPKLNKVHIKSNIDIKNALNTINNIIESRGNYA